MPGSDQPKRPLRIPEYLVLIALADRELHGYGIVQTVAAESAGRVQLVPGNLYVVLRRLAEWGLIAESNRRPAPDLDDERRRYYKLTPAGRRIAAREAVRFREMARLAETKELIPRGES